MDDHAFDDLAKSVQGGGSRRTILKSAAGGGLAALLVALGLNGVNGKTVEAGQKHRKPRKRRHHHNHTPPPPPPPPICPPVTGVAVNPAGQANGTACTGGDPAACTSGYCTSTLCQPCPSTCNLASGGTVCCPNGAFCTDGACRVPCS